MSIPDGLNLSSELAEQVQRAIDRRREFVGADIAGRYDATLSVEHLPELVKIVLDDLALFSTLVGEVSALRSRVDALEAERG